MPASTPLRQCFTGPFPENSNYSAIAQRKNQARLGSLCDEVLYLPEIKLTRVKNVGDSRFVVIYQIPITNYRGCETR
jgi:hypothetical protein